MLHEMQGVPQGALSKERIGNKQPKFAPHLICPTPLAYVLVTLICRNPILEDAAHCPDMAGTYVYRLLGHNL